ncbi:hypothetical protein EYC80_003316 [Monilinia laxa]|uniref:Uncharacterized protein n=1 Tax=Monilinia laxa TaxID=61186 RepID=A0A5N6KEN5_MONLA|nr:hypothetical protein EYC80_003316 [Monilinia laxa]
MASLNLFDKMHKARSESGEAKPEAISRGAHRAPLIVFLYSYVAYKQQFPLLSHIQLFLLFIALGQKGVGTTNTVRLISASRECVMRQNYGKWHYSSSV